MMSGALRMIFGGLYMIVRKYRMFLSMLALKILEIRWVS